MDFSNLFGSIFSPEAIEEAARESYADKRDSKNNLSYWYPKIKDVSGISSPRTITQKFSFDEYQAISEIYIDRKKRTEEQESIIEEKILKPWRQAKEEFGDVFVKTGTYSNKFDFKTAIEQSEDLIDLESIGEIFYADTMRSAQGTTEMNYREIIPWDKSTPTIYNGMPLRPEYRVFYDFDQKKVLYTVEYWEYETMVNGIYDEEDLETYQSYYPKLHKLYKDNLGRVLDHVNKTLVNVSELDGDWSVDYMIDDHGKIWLIDMAEAHRSAYYDTEKILKAKEE